MAANNLQQNFSADLTNDNLATVVAGGSAADISPGSTRKRRNATGGLSSQLGIS